MYTYFISIYRRYWVRKKFRESAILLIIVSHPSWHVRKWLSRTHIRQRRRTIITHFRVSFVVGFLVITQPELAVCDRLAVSFRLLLFQDMTSILCSCILEPNLKVKKETLDFLFIIYQYINHCFCCCCCFHNEPN